MFFKTLFRHTLTYSMFRTVKKTNFSLRRNLYQSGPNFAAERGEDTKALTLSKHFEQIQNKNKNTYLEMIQMFVNNDSVHRRGHVEFIYAALRNMENFGVQKDLEVYKSLIDIMPKGKFIPTNLLQVEFMHYPKQQQCIVDLLEQMEENGVMPDYEMEDMLVNVFGKRGFPLRKFWRMMYWMPKFKNLSPWPLPDQLPSDVLELAKLAIARISSADVLSELRVYQTSDVKDAIEDTWIVSSQSPVQRRLLEEHDVKEPIYVEGAFKVWLRDVAVDYFILRAAPKALDDKIDDIDDVGKIKAPIFLSKPPIKEIIKYPSVHEQEDGVILAVCATGASSKDSLLSWIRLLEKDGNPALATVPIVFTLKSSSKEIANIEEENKTDQIVK